MQWTQCTEGVYGQTCSRDGALEGLTVDHVEIVILLTPPAYSGKARCNSSTPPPPPLPHPSVYSGEAATLGFTRYYGEHAGPTIVVEVEFEVHDFLVLLSEI